MISDLLTENISHQELPLPAMEIRHVLAIESAIRYAWRALLSSNSAKILREGDEKYVTIELIRVLEEIRLNGVCPPFDEKNFGRVSRGEEFISFNGASVEKRPDITFSLKARRPGVRTSLAFYDRLFAECKILNDKGANIGLYAENGIGRFIRGEYAWAMPHSLMLGYLRTSVGLPETLDDHLQRSTNLQKLSVASLPQQCRGNRQEPFIYQTAHRRDWKYRTGNSPGNITIRHLWLNALLPPTS